MRSNHPITFGTGIADLTLNCDVNFAGAVFTTVRTPAGQTLPLGGVTNNRDATLTLGNRAAHAQGTAFTCAGELTDNAAPATGVFDFDLRLYAYRIPGGIRPGLVPADDRRLGDGPFTVVLG